MGSTSPNNTVLDRLLEPVLDCLTPDVAQRMVDTKVDQQTQAHIDELAEKANEGELTDAERSEYESCVEAIDLVAILKAKARRVLARHSS